MREELRVIIPPPEGFLTTMAPPAYGHAEV